MNIKIIYIVLQIYNKYMELKQLKYFVTIVQEGTFSSAAKKLHMTQPPLSYQIQMLEEELGVPLLIRGARKTELSDAGKVFYQKAVMILMMEKRTREQMKEIASGTAGEIRIGLISSARDDFIHTFLSPFLKKYPAVSLKIHETDTSRMMDLLSSEAIDLAAVRTPFPVKGLDVIVLKHQKFFAVRYGKEMPASVSLHEIAGEPLIVYRRWESVLKEAADRELNIRYEAEDAGTCAKLMEEGLGTALLPESAVPEAADVHAAVLKDPQIQTDICMVRVRMAYHSTAAETFWKEMKERNG